MIFTLEVFFFTAVVAIGTFRSITTIVCTTMSIGYLLAHVRNINNWIQARTAMLCVCVGGCGGVVGIEIQIMCNILC